MCSPGHTGRGEKEHQGSKNSGIGIEFVVSKGQRRAEGGGKIRGFFFEMPKRKGEKRDRRGEVK